jgi:hypothetical protein
MQKRKATKQDVSDFVTFKKLRIPQGEADKMVENDELVYTSSDFQDETEFTALITTKGLQVGYWPGY